jgi:seryl-tRNA synthetase
MADGDSTQSGADGTQSGDAETTTTTAETGTGEGTQSGADTTTQTDAEAQRARAEAETFRERMKAADQRAAKFEEELRKLRDKDLPQAEKLQRDFAESQKQVTALQETTQRLSLENAFLKDNSYKWHNPERALKLVDLSQVEIDSEGKVSGLKDALKALATSDPYLLANDVKETTDNKTPPGTAPGTNGANGTGKPNAAAMTSRFPVMRTRVKPQ